MINHVICLFDDNNEKYNLSEKIRCYNNKIKITFIQRLEFSSETVLNTVSKKGLYDIKSGSNYYPEDLTHITTQRFLNLISVYKLCQTFYNSKFLIIEDISLFSLNQFDIYYFFQEYENIFDIVQFDSHPEDCLIRKTNSVYKNECLHSLSKIHVVSKSFIDYFLKNLFPLYKTIEYSINDRLNKLNVFTIINHDNKKISFNNLENKYILINNITIMIFYLLCVIIFIILFSNYFIFIHCK